MTGGSFLVLAGPFPASGSSQNNNSSGGDLAATASNGRAVERLLSQIARGRHERVPVGCDGQAIHPRRQSFLRQCGLGHRALAAGLVPPLDTSSSPSPSGESFAQLRADNSISAWLAIVRG